MIVSRGTKINFNTNRMGFFDFLKPKKVFKPDPEEDKSKPENTIHQSFISDGARFEFPDNSKVDLIEDPFEKTKILRFYSAGSFVLDKYLFFTEKTENFLIGFRVESDVIKLIFSTYRKEIKLSKDDVVRVLFDDKEVLDFNLEKTGYKHEDDGNGIVIESYSIIDEAILRRFVEHDMHKIRLQTKDDLNHTVSLDIETAEKFCEAAFAFHYCLKNFYQKGDFKSAEEYYKEN